MMLLLLIIIIIIVVILIIVIIIIIVIVIIITLAGEAAPRDRGRGPPGDGLYSPASKRGQDERFFCRSAAIYNNYDIIMA